MIGRAAVTGTMRRVSSSQIQRLTETGRDNDKDRTSAVSVVADSRASHRTQHHHQPAASAHPDLPYLSLQNFVDLVA